MNVVRSGRGRSSPAIRQTGWPSALRFEVPQRAVEGVARAAGRQQPAQRLAVDAGLDVAAHVLDRRAHALDVVAEVIDACRLTSPAAPRSLMRATTADMSVNVYPVIVNGADSGISSRVTDSCISSSC